MLDLIRHLSPKPGLAFYYETSPAVIPEVLMVWDPATAGWAVDLNPETTPKILLNTSFYTRIKDTTADAQVRHYLAEQMNHANWLLKALHQRATTLIRTAKEIIACQELFFQKGVSFMRPLVLRDIASAINMHESTISRVTSNKYIATPRGIFELKYFFNSSLENAHGEAVSSESVRHRLRALIDEEAPHAPLSDESLALKLQADGTDIARRTIAKYREMMGIAPAFQRRRSRHLRKPAPSLA
jgi:RNA polymerase sigma-54 factor